MSFVKKKIHEMFHQPETRIFSVVNYALAILTVFSVTALILETVERFESYGYIFSIIEYTAVFFFTLEYVGRIIISEKKKHYLFGFFGIVDLLAIVPSYLLLTNLTFLKAARVLHIVRFLRVVRLVKVTHIFQHPHSKKAKRHNIQRLDMQIYFFALLSAVVIFGTLLYMAESGNEGSANIPLAMVWVSKAILGGISQFTPGTVWGDIVIIATRFTGLLLFGFLIHMVGGYVNKFLFGTEDPGGPVSK